MKLCKVFAFLCAAGFQSSKRVPIFPYLLVATLSRWSFCVFIMPSLTGSAHPIVQQPSVRSTVPFVATDRGFRFYLSNNHALEMSFIANVETKESEPSPQPPDQEMKDPAIVSTTEVSMAQTPTPNAQPQPPLSAPRVSRAPKAVYALGQVTPHLHPEMTIKVFREVEALDVFPIHVDLAGRSECKRITRCEFNVGNGAFGNRKFIVFFPARFLCQVAIYSKSAIPATPSTPPLALESLRQRATSSVFSRAFSSLMSLKSDIAPPPGPTLYQWRLVRKYEVAPYTLQPVRKI